LQNMARLAKQTPRGKAKSSPKPFALSKQLAGLGRNIYRRGWAVGTSGNFSAVLNRYPLRLVITHTGVDKGTLKAEQILEIDGNGKAVNNSGSPSAEAKLHLAIVRGREAGAVLHTHSVWSTIVSEAHAPQGGVSIEGYEMLKGLEGVGSHQHREWVPIIENSQDMRTLARAVDKALKTHPTSHGFLLRGHGLYTWGKNLAEAKRHVEILEFLFEVLGRKAGFGDEGLELRG
jgi:methylthioribulose-1-phosphate dehydratase